MRHPLARIVLVLGASILLTGCRIDQFFSQLSQSNEEAGARESIQQAELLAQRQGVLESKRKNYTYSVPLLSPPGIRGVNGVMYAFMTPSRQGTLLEVDGYIPKPTFAYFLWLTNEEQSEFIPVAVLESREYEHYTLKINTPNDYSTYPIVVVEDEASPAAKPVNPVLAGKLLANPQ